MLPSVRKTRTVLLALTTMIAARASVARGDTSDEKARSLRDEATQAASDRDFETCKAKAAESWALVKDAETEGLLGVCEVELHAFRDGASHLDEALAKVADPDNRIHWREELASAKTQVGELNVTSAIPNCVIRVDHAEVGGVAPKTIFLNPGRHIVEGFSEGHVPQAFEVFVEAGQQQPIDFDLELPGAEVKAGRPLWPGVVGLGVGMIALTIGSGLIAKHGSTLDDATKAGAGLKCKPAQLNAACQEVSDRADAAELMGNAGVWTLVGGVATFAAGTGLLIWGLTAPRRPPPKERTVVVIPAFDPHLGALLVKGSF